MDERRVGRTNGQPKNLMPLALAIVGVFVFQWHNHLPLSQKLCVIKCLNYKLL